MKSITPTSPEPSSWQRWLVLFSCISTLLLRDLLFWRTLTKEKPQKDWRSQIKSKGIGKVQSCNRTVSFTMIACQWLLSHKKMKKRVDQILHSCIHMAPLDLSKRHVTIQMLYLRLITWWMNPCLTHFRGLSISASENQAWTKYVRVHLCAKGSSADGVKNLTASCNGVVRYFVKYD